MQLSEHFSLSEFERSKTAQTYNIVNRVPEALLPNLQALCLNVLEPLRQYAKEPVEISSGYRCPALNQKVGGQKNSQHLRAEAADIRHKNKGTLKRWFLWMMDNLAFDQLIWEVSRKSSGEPTMVELSRGAAETRQSPTLSTKGYSTWIHVSYCANPRKNRQQVIFT